MTIRSRLIATILKPRSKFTFTLLATITAIVLIAIPSEAKPHSGAPVAIGSGNIFQALVLGLVQGITEFLPISSTAHLIVTTKILGWEELGSKDYVDAIQFGSVIAVFIYFWKDITSLLKGGFAGIAKQDWADKDVKVLAGIAIGTLPALIIGLLFKDFIPETAGTIAIMSLVMATLLFLAERYGTRKRDFDRLEIKDGLLVGLAQTIALIPGASRSGSTLTAGLFLGLERETAARFSFLVGLPVLTLATLYKSLKIFQAFKEHLLPDNIVLLLAVGIVSSFVFSYLSIAFLLNYLKTKDTTIFVIYRYAFGVSLLAAVAMGWKA
jgi:undecaprenyl-diphosphatase